MEELVEMEALEALLIIVMMEHIVVTEVMAEPEAVVEMEALVVEMLAQSISHIMIII